MTRLRSALRTTLLVLFSIVVPLVTMACVSPEVNWRLSLLGLKATGRLPTLDWADLLPMMMPGSGIWLEPLVESRNPYAVIRSPRTSERDVLTGKALFRANCQACHGPGARGASAPALVGRDLAHGASDWAIFQTIRNGVPGTPMQPHGFSDNDKWKLVSYLQNQITARADETARAATAELPALDVRFAALSAARSATADWPTYYGSYNGHRFSTLAQIDRRNVAQLQTRWIHQLPSRAARIEATPLVASGRLFITDPQGDVLALDSATGAQLWRFSRPMTDSVPLCCARANRGVALLDGTVYVGTLDAYLVALDAVTGKLKWYRKIAEYRDGYSSTGAPLIVKDMVLVGIAGAEYGARGFIAAFDASTGEPRWRVETVPAPGQKGNETWAGDSWRHGGASTWMTGTYDPELDLVFWGTGNPAPDYDASLRAGDNLYANSVLALHADTGRLAWYFQYTPGDDHDWDAVQTPVLADVQENGQTRKLLLNANRNGFFYVLDRVTGQFLRAVPYVKQTWAERIEPNGRPVKRADSAASERGTLVFPGTSGGTNWWPPTFNPMAQLFIVPALERPGIFFKSAVGERGGGSKILGGSVQTTSTSHFTAVRALDPLTGELRWEYRTENRFDGADMSGLLSTAGGLVFASNRSKLVALDITDGHPLWSFEAGGNIYTPPATYLAGSEQYLVFAAGDVVIGMALPPPLPTAAPRTARNSAGGQ
jgi:alcohol dehydrogenase (cytochrome c)